MGSQKTLLERITEWIKNSPVTAYPVLFGKIIIAPASFVGAAIILMQLIHENPEAARIKLKQMGVDTNSQSLIENVKKGDLIIVKLLLVAKVDPNEPDERMNTALMYAAAEGQTPTLKALLRAGADVDKKNKYGATALSWAARGGKLDSLNLLLNKGAKSINSALIWAASGGHREIVDILLHRGADREAVNSAFVSAARNGHLEIMRLLLDQGADVKKVGGEALGHVTDSRIAGVTDEDLSATAHFLLDLGVDVNGTYKDGGWTPLLLATSNEYRMVVGVLLDTGVDVNAACDCPGYSGGGWTPLLIAVERKMPEIVEALLSKGADVNKSNRKGCTALMLAVQGHDTRNFHVLLDRGADINVSAAWSHCINRNGGDRLPFIHLG